MLFPFNTDAPIYYWPYTTVAMIVVNVLVFVWELSNPEMAVSLCLETGSGLHPVQWLTSNFAHLDIVHIAGNMIFLWAFGLIVEGKLGWWKTLILYLGLGIVQSAFEQTIMLFGETHYILGASGIIYGFMAMSLIWAPENSLQCIMVLGMRYVRWIEVPIKFFVAGFVALQVLETVLTSMTMSSALLHVTGAALGFAAGIWMLKTKRVDCENWDIFSVAAGRHRMTQEQLDEEVVKSAKYQQWQEKRTSQRTADAVEWIRQRLGEGNAKAAVELYRRLRSETPDWTLPEEDLYRLIAALSKAGSTADAIPLMADYLSHYSTHATGVRIALGDALLREHRPAQALKVLGKLSAAALDERRRQIVRGLREKARKQCDDDPYEVADQDW